MAEPVEGWEGSVETVDGDAIVTFAGGPLADDVEGTFEVTMTLPPTPDTTIYFPFVQRCEVGEIRWIGIPTEPGEELDEPAPAMTLTGPVATTVAPPTTEPATTESSATTESPTTTDGPATSESPATTSAETDTAPPSTEAVIAANDDEGGDSGTGTIVFIASIAAVLGLGAFVAWRARQSRAGSARDVPPT